MAGISGLVPSLQERVAAVQAAETMDELVESVSVLMRVLGVPLVEAVLAGRGGPTPFSSTVRTVYRPAPAPSRVVPVPLAWTSGACSMAANCWASASMATRCLR
jgi:hypothetical protein